MLLPPFLQRWILLNIVRLATIVTCALVIGATIRRLKLNFDHYPPPLSATLASSSPAYYPSTDIPTTFLGVFWSTLHHVSLVVVLFIVILSELSLPIPLLHRLFKNTLPFLGPNWGTGFLGVLLVLVAGDGLSRGEVGGKFAEVSSWCLASLGLANVGVGVVWRAKAKVVRSPMGWKKDVAEKMDKLAEAKKNAERVVDDLPLPTLWKNNKEKEGLGSTGIKGLKGLAGKFVTSKMEKSKQSGKNQQSKEGEKDLEKAQAQTHFSNGLPAHVPASAWTARTAPEMSIFTPPLPSAIVGTRSTEPPETRPAAGATFVGVQSCSSSTFSDSTTTLSVPPTIAATTQPRFPPPPLLHTRSPSTSTLSTLSTYTLDTAPAQTTSTSNSPPPPVKTVRFLTVPTSESPQLNRGRIIHSHHAQPEELGVGGSKFLLLPTGGSEREREKDSLGLSEGERSPSVMASLKAAMLEAEAKAKAKPSKKSIYLGSLKWLADYTGTSDDANEKEKCHNEPESSSEKKTDKGPSRPYDFL